MPATTRVPRQRASSTSFLFSRDERSRIGGRTVIAVERPTPGRWDQLRPVTGQEIKATTVIGMDIDDAAAKVRAGPPKNEDDQGIDARAGVLPLAVAVGEPGVSTPDHLKDWRLG